MDRIGEADRPRGGKGESKIRPEDRAASIGIGVFMLLVGVGCLVGFSYTHRAPSKLFILLAAGGVAALLSGVGLILQPLDGERLRAFQHEPNPIAVFRLMPVFWKAWLLVIFAAMIGAVVYVSQNTVRVR